jgi:hypothetical protein
LETSRLANLLQKYRLFIHHLGGTVGGTRCAIDRLSNRFKLSGDGFALRSDMRVEV